VSAFFVAYILPYKSEKKENNHS